MASSTASQETSAEVGAVTAPDAELSHRRLARRLQRSSDRLLLIGAAGVVAASVFLTPSTEAVSLLGWEVPPLCIFSSLLGIECFGCGLTRSFTYVGNGQLEQALRMHKLGPLLYLLVFAQIPLRSWRLWKTRHPIGADATHG